MDEPGPTKSVLLGASLYTEKIITLLAMAVVTFLCGMLPLKLFTQLRHNSDPVSRTWWKSFISFCSCFSGGVFIAACLLDLLPDVEEKILEVGRIMYHCINIRLSCYQSQLDANIFRWRRR